MWPHLYPCRLLEFSIRSGTMIELALLSYIPDPFGVQESRYMVFEPQNGTRLLSARELSAYASPILTYDVAAVVDDLRRLNHAPPKSILDLGDALRLLVARSRDDGGEKLWSVWPAIKRFFDSHVDADTFERIVESKMDRPELSEQERLLSEAIKALQRQWKGLVLETAIGGGIASFSFS